LFDIFSSPLASLSTTRLQVRSLETKLKASTKALEEAQAQIAAAEARHKKQLEAVVKEAEARVAEVVSKKETDQATREEEVRVRLDILSSLFGGKYHKSFCLFPLYFALPHTDILHMNQQIGLAKSYRFGKTLK
jgi:multidrug efflux pump subunit AcrA (membrane-fusion protein)